MAGKKNMKNFEATFLNMKDETVVKKEFLARNHTSALRKANRLITKNVRVLTVDQIAMPEVVA
jgi:superfamily I DNA/RNA helicase